MADQITGDSLHPGFNSIQQAYPIAAASDARNRKRDVGRVAADRRAVLQALLGCFGFGPFMFTVNASSDEREEAVT
jgi:hypothetical protein